ncbi:hypothetical protein KP509_11G067200 [Ceratopteris richardii]|uniref:Uncharacterized protein n=1 Tax=Ceratopteris richardii TaxID=49495 RepID=A0A8T2TQQ2_CERRI|nr:hypothetical protein KP509_11G067200 [Ceratopteris richardii]
MQFMLLQSLQATDLIPFKLQKEVKSNAREAMPVNLARPLLCSRAKRELEDMRKAVDALDQEIQNLSQECEKLMETLKSTKEMHEREYEMLAGLTTQLNEVVMTTNGRAYGLGMLLDYNYEGASWFQTLHSDCLYAISSYSSSFAIAPSSDQQ